MSYILEALKKSEEARQREASTAVPILPQSARPAASRKSAVHITGMLILSVIVGSCFLAAGYFFFFQPQEETIAQDIPSTTAPSEPDQSRQGATNNLSQADTSIPELYPGNKKMAVLPHAPTANDEILQPAPLATTIPPRQETSPSSAQQPAPTIPYLEELAPSIQKSIPDLQLAGHVFSAAPHLRMIVINNTIVRENDVVAQNLVLEEITRQGVILRSGNKRFRLDAQ